MLGDLEIQESRYSFSLGPLGQRRPLPAKSRQNHPNSFLDNIKQAFILFKKFCWRQLNVHFKNQTK